MAINSGLVYEKSLWIIRSTYPILSIANVIISVEQEIYVTTD